MFIVIEGCDRFGKSTQLDLLFGKLVQTGHRVVKFSFPFYDSDTGRAIDKHLHNQLFLAEPANFTGKINVSQYDALAFQCIQTVNKYEAVSKINRHLREGAIVVCGRWWQSAYLYGLDDGLDQQWLIDVHSCLPMPDLNILLDYDPELAAQRAGGPGDRFEADLAKQKRLRDAYLQLWNDPLFSHFISRFSEWFVVSASGGPAEVHERVCECIREPLLRYHGWKG